jgi:hypothetical protein
MDLDTFGDTVDHPVLRNPGLRVETELGRSVVGQRGLGHLDEQKYVLRGGRTLFVRYRAPKVRLSTNAACRALIGDISTISPRISSPDRSL